MLEGLVLRYKNGVTRNFEHVLISRLPGRKTSVQHFSY
jgi:hypothetical protein